MYKENRSYVVTENCGQKMFGVYHRPDVEGIVPTILVCHGFGGNKIGSHRLFVLFAEQMVKLGIATLRVDLRGSGDSEGDFKEMTLQGEVSDLLTWVQYLESQASSIGLLGVSLGGAVSILTAERFKKIKALALWAPVASADQWKEAWQFEKKSPDPYVIHNGKVTSRTFFEQFFTMDLGSSLNNLNQLPLFHAHGEMDDVVSPSHQERYKEWRKSASAKSHFLRLAKSDHTFSQLEEQQNLIDETANWFKNTL